MDIKVLEILPQNERYLISDLKLLRHLVIKVGIAQAYKIDESHEVSPWRSIRWQEICYYLLKICFPW